MNRSKVERQGFILILRSKLFEKILEPRLKRFFEKIEPIVIISGFVGMAIVTYFLISSIVELFIFGKTSKIFAVVLPGLEVPGTGIRIPVLEGFISIFICAFVHEYGHAIYARLKDIYIRSAGFVLIGPLLGAFVEPDERALKIENLKSKLSILFAGPFFNILVYFLTLLIFHSIFPIYSSTFKTVEHIIYVDEVIPGSPVYNSGIEPGTLIFGVNGTSIKNFTHFINLIKSVKPNDIVVFQTDHGNITVKVGEKEGKPYYGFVVSPFIYYKNKFLYDLLRYILGFLSLLGALNLGIGLANLLPILPLDGGKAIFFILSEKFGEEKAQRISIKITLMFLALLLFNMLVGFIYHGRLH